MTDISLEAVYGEPPADLVEVSGAAVQVSPVHPGAAALDAIGEGSLARMTMLAPPGTVERRYAVALALRALASGAALIVLAPKTRGGSRLRAELEAFGCAVSETAKRHHRICVCERPATIDGLDEALRDGAPRLVAELGLWSQPGVFSWDRIDPGSFLLAQHLPKLSGAGADLGCGIGFLARAVLSAPKVTRLTLIDSDRRAIECARRNVEDARVALRWADVRSAGGSLAGLDFVVMNPPFHAGGQENQALGQAFIRAAAAALRKGGTLWLVANRHLPYEGVLKDLFTRVAPPIEGGGYKIFEARR